MAFSYRNAIVLGSSAVVFLVLGLSGPRRSPRASSYMSYSSCVNHGSGILDASVSAPCQRAKHEPDNRAKSHSLQRTSRALTAAGARIWCRVSCRLLRCRAATGSWGVGLLDIHRHPRLDRRGRHRVCGLHRAHRSRGTRERADMRAAHRGGEHSVQILLRMPSCLRGIFPLSLPDLQQVCCRF